MADKLRDGIAVVPEFVDGEKPTAAKLNTLGIQLSRAAKELEKAVGDIHGESHPYTTSTTTKLTLPWGRSPNTGLKLPGTEDRSLDIVNLARLIGPASNLNPKMLGGKTQVEDPVPVGLHEFSLTYPVQNTASVVFSDNTVFATFVANPSNLSAAGEYSVTDEGKVYCVTASNGGTATYDTNPNRYRGGINYTSSRFNVIPDPNQTSAGGANLSVSGPDANGRYTVTLPTISHQQSNIDFDSAALSDKDINFNVQLKLPLVLENNFTAGQTIPEGFLYLKNETTGEVYKDAEYIYNNSTSLLVGNIDLTDPIANADRLSIITVGTDITTTLDDLRNKLFHTHNRSAGEPFVDIAGISGALSAAGNKGPFVPSEIPGNHFPQYLHRDGWASGVDSTNLNDGNAMRGDIMFGAVSGTAGGYVLSTGETFGLRFGSGGARIYKDANNNLIIDSDTGKEIHTTGGPLIVEGGFAGVTTGLVDLVTPGHGAPFFGGASLTPDAGGNATFNGTSTLRSKTWVAVNAYVNNGFNVWWSNNNDASWGLQVKFYDDGTDATKEVQFKFTGTSWDLTGNTSYLMRIVIWYV